MKKFIILICLSFTALPLSAELTYNEIAQVDAFLGKHFKKTDKAIRIKLRKRMINNQKFKIDQPLERVHIDNPDEAFKRLCQMSFLTEIQFNRLNLSIIPAEIQYLTKATKINISGNVIKTLPDEVENLAELTGFNLAGNPIQQLSFNLLRMPKLKNLYLIPDFIPQESSADTVGLRELKKHCTKKSIDLELVEKSEVDLLAALSNEITPALDEMHKNPDYMALLNFFKKELNLDADQ